MVSLKNEQKYMLLSPKISRLNIELSRNIVRKHIFPEDLCDTTKSSVFPN